MEAMEVVFELHAELVTNLAETEDVLEKEKLIHAHIEQLISRTSPVKDFKSGLEWFNVSAPLSLRRDLAGKLVLLDFFTYCCINCLHVLPELKKLEEKFSPSQGLVVVGVHSAKFDTEKDSENVGAAVRRHEISHPVVNDSQCDMWNELQIVCWPTLLLLSPSGHPLFIVMGEGHTQLLDLLVRVSLAHFSDKLILGPMPQLSPRHHVVASSGLKFPGRVALRKEKLAVADSGHHRVLVLETSTGVVQQVIGTGELGLKDGGFGEAKFWCPQGLAWADDDTLFVADTENHSIRKIDFQAGVVTRVAGNGKRGTDHAGGEGPATLQPLNSPWGLTMDPSGRVLLISMAGSHQIWGLILEDVTWWKNKKLAKDTCMALVGSGREENRNSGYPMAAGLAQPSGMIFAGPQRLLFADSESSSIRLVSLVDGKVSGVVGGEKDPLNLFAYGDCDGRGTSCRLQHPLDVAWSETKQRLYVADTFNHKIKEIDLENCTATSCKLHPPKLKFSEPGGLCVDEVNNQLIVADTNNHAIKLVPLDGVGEISELMVRFPSVVDCGHDLSDINNITVGINEGKLRLSLHVLPPADSKPAPEAPQSWRLIDLPASWSAAKMKGMLSHTEENTLVGEIELNASAEKSSVNFGVAVNAVSCSGGQCRMHQLRAAVSVQREESAPCEVNKEILLKI